MAIKIDELDLPSGEFVTKEEKERIWSNQEPFFLIGGEPKVQTGFVNSKGEPVVQTVYSIIIREPDSGDESERLLALGHTRRREALAIAAVQATDKIGPCYLHRLPASPGKNPPWSIGGEKDPNIATGNGKAKGKGSNVPWGDES